MISSPKKLWLALVTALSIVAVTGCNDTLRQFIIPIPKPAGDAGARANAVVLSQNPAGNGSTMHIDVSGDTQVGNVVTGPNPVFLGLTASRAFVINGNNTLTSYITLLPTSPPFSSIVLPTGPPDTATTPVAGGTSSSGNFFTTNSGSNNISIVSAGLLAETGSVSVGTEPVSIAGNSANSKMYVINHGSNNVTVVSTTDNTVVKTIPVGSNPIWGVMANNGVQVFVVNQGDGTVSVIDTTLDEVIHCTPGLSCNASTGAITVGASPNFAFYDSNRQRLYVSNTGSSSISVIKADGIDLGVTPQILPGLLANITVSAPPVSVAATPDGSKAYAALGGCPAGVNHTNLVANLASCNGNKLSVIDANALVEKKTITVGVGAVSVATSSDSLRAYVVSAHDTTTIASNVTPPQPSRTYSTPSLYIIQTSTDTVITPTVDASITSRPIPTFFTPPQDPTCLDAIDTSFNTKVAQPCIRQVPFVVRTFP